VEQERFEGNKCTLTLSQRWYLENGEIDETGIKWFIPLNVCTGDQTSLLILEEARKEIVIDLPAEDSFVSLN